MYNVIVNKIPHQKWFSEKAKEVVDKFSAYAKENKSARLMLSLYSEHESVEDLDCALEEGMYEFIFPSNNPHSEELRELIEEGEKCARYLGFDSSCLAI